MPNKGLSVVVYGCETSSLTLREERRLRVFQNRVLRGIFGPYRGEVTGEWRKIHNEELSDMCSHQILFRRANREELDGRACSTCGGERGEVYTGFW